MRTALIATSIALLAACTDPGGLEQRAEDLEERRSEADGVDPLTEELREHIARTRADLARDVGADPTAWEHVPARTAAEVLHHRDDGDPLAPGESY